MIRSVLNMGVKCVDILIMNKWQSFRLYVDEVKEYQLKHQKQEDLCPANHSIDQVRLLLQTLQVFHQVEYEEG